MTGPESPAPSPAIQRERIPELDVLRGFAILGILLLNIRSFSMPDGASWYPSYYEHFDTIPDRTVWFIGEIFWSHKFYPLLAALFGAGIVLMAESAEAAGLNPDPIHYRRIAGLLLIGLFHAYLMWHGDILVQYALCGALAYLFRKRGPLVLLALAIAFFVLNMALFSIELPQGLIEIVDTDSYQEMRGSELEILRGPWLGQLPLRAAESFRMHTLGLIGCAQSLGLMLLGMALLKTGWLSGQRSPRAYLWLAIIGSLTGWALAFVGISGWLMQDLGGGPGWTFMFVWTLNGGTVAMLGYLGFVQWWVKRGGFPKLRAILEALGRTALSNYLLQSLLAGFIFHGQGLGLFGHVSRTGQLFFVLLIWSIQIILTLIWLKHFQGPLEMLLRRKRLS